MKTLKNLMPLTIIIFVLILFSTACTGEVTNTKKDIVLVWSDYKVYNTISDLYEEADLVIEGKVLNSRVELMAPIIELGPEEKLDPKLNPGGSPKAVKRPWTIYTIEVKRVYKGDISEKETIEVKQIGGETDTAIYIQEDAPKIEKNAEYILFLATYDNFPASLLNNIQSLYKVENGKLVGHPKNTLELNYEELNNLKSKKK